MRYALFLLFALCAVAVCCFIAAMRFVSSLFLRFLVCCYALANKQDIRAKIMAILIRRLSLVYFYRLSHTRQSGILNGKYAETIKIQMLYYKVIAEIERQ